jgi:hypothetical protein
MPRKCRTRINKEFRLALKRKAEAYSRRGSIVPIVATQSLHELTVNNSLPASGCFGLMRKFNRGE